MKFILGRYRKKDTTVRDSPIVRKMIGSDLISPVLGMYRKRSSPIGRKQLIRTSRRTERRSILFYRWKVWKADLPLKRKGNDILPDKSQRVQETHECQRNSNF